jgi:hypothetical protein
MKYSMMSGIKEAFLVGKMSANQILSNKLFIKIYKFPKQWKNKKKKIK